MEISVIIPAYVISSMHVTINFDTKPYIDLCRIMGLDVMIFNTHPVIDLYSYETGSIGNIPYIKLNSFIVKNGELALKRFIDIIKPGITGMWQVSGRNTIVDFDEIVKLDIEYIDKWSIWLDIKILFKTVLVVIKGVGAS